jgi:serine/threonine protein phosphatase PrpC
MAEDWDGSTMVAPNTGARTNVGETSNDAWASRVQRMDRCAQRQPVSSCRDLPPISRLRVGWISLSSIIGSMDSLLKPSRCVTSYGATDIGRRRTCNEDAFLNDDELGLYVVADGMGGHAAGEVASQEAVEAVYGMVKQGLRALPERLSTLTNEHARAATRLMEGAVQAATYMVFALGELDQEKSGMGTTISALLVLGDYAVTGQVGDSRIYQIHAGQARQITEDHTLISWQLKQGLITADEAKRSPHRNVITRAIGNHEYVEVDTGLIAIEPKDQFLLCSDGLHTYLQDEEIAIMAELGGRTAVEQLIERANQRGGKDNITAIVVEIS